MLFREQKTLNLSRLHPGPVRAAAAFLRNVNHAPMTWAALCWPDAAAQETFTNVHPMLNVEAIIRS